MKKLFIACIVILALAFILYKLSGVANLRAAKQMENEFGKGNYYILDGVGAEVIGRKANGEVVEVNTFENGALRETVLIPAPAH